jgi:BirA family biotin operon repressor/biotin-[acetyl-CoA-carboxylase] ligase
MPETLEPTLIAGALRTATLPRTIRSFEAVGSTMDVARELLSTLPETQLPLLVLAEVQTAGRGRLGRRWEAAPGTALMFSLSLRPSWLPPERAVALVWMTATALCEAVEEVTPVRASLKWPNDLLLPHAGGAAKAAGILLEVSLGGRGVEWATIGCGVNVSAAPPPELTRYPATSLAAAAGGAVSRLELLLALLHRLDAWHARLMAGEEEALFHAWRARITGLGRPARVETAAGPLEGTAEGVDRSGALLIRDAAGALHSVTTGDVGLVP